MSPLTVSQFALASGVAGLVLVALAAVLRSRAYATFRAVLLTIHVMLATAMYRRVLGEVPVLAWPFLYAHACVYVHTLALTRPRLRPLPYRVLVSWPEAWFQAGTFLGLPWAVLGLFWDAPGWWLGYVAAALGMVQVFAPRHDTVSLVVGDGTGPEVPARHAHGEDRVERPLRLAQITDPHLGPFMSVARLARICRRVVEREPDLVLLTGDFLTMEAQADPAWLSEALAPLQALPGKVFACLGNHDLEAPETVKKALADNGVTLLVDEATTVATPAGKVQIVGADFRWSDRSEHLGGLAESAPREEGALRLWLLHDPGAFKHVPEGEADLVLAGHTHGGQVGLVSLGLPGTMVSAVAKMPDHGFWARGPDRMWVHRGTGHYGFPVRLGVPREESLLEVHAVG